MTVVAARSATMTGPFTRLQVFRPQEIELLVDAVLAEDDHDLGAQRVLYDQDVLLPHPPGWVPETVLVVTVNRGWGAAYYRAHDETGQGWAWITHNARPAAGVPGLLFDPEAGTDYPPEAAIPVRQLRRVVEEYLRTGERPAAVEWRPADRYMVY